LFSAQEFAGTDVAIPRFETAEDRALDFVLR
jgi:hypothetical protein